MLLNASKSDLVLTDTHLDRKRSMLKAQKDYLVLMFSLTTRQRRLIVRYTHRPTITYFC